MPRSNAGRQLLGLRGVVEHMQRVDDLTKLGPHLSTVGGTARGPLVDQHPDGVRIERQTEAVTLCSPPTETRCVAEDRAGAWRQTPGFPIDAFGQDQL